MTLNRKMKMRNCSRSLNTSINRKRISDNSHAKRLTRALFFVKKKQKREDDDSSDVFDVVDDSDAANKIEENDDDDELARNERDVDNDDR